MSEEKNQYKLTPEILASLCHIEGFPIGKDEDVIALSDPPHYTACPNPWIGEFIEKYGRPYDPNEEYHREPFASDVSEGKNDPIYNAHSYHTKVPHKAIMRYILHYTNPGDLIFDGFCGTGMTGVAAQMCENPDPEFKAKIEQEMPGVKWGARRSILCDLSPAATFIAHNYNNPIDLVKVDRDSKRILKEIEAECGWMYETNHVINGVQQVKKELNGTVKPIKGKINFTIWSDVFVCPSCSQEIIYWNAAVNHIEKKLMDEFLCPHCGALVTKRSMQRAMKTVYNQTLHQSQTQAKQVPVYINYSIIEDGKEKRFEKFPDNDDFLLLETIENANIPYWYPLDEIPDGYNTEQPKISHGISRIHQFYTKRNLWTLAKLHDYIWNNCDRYFQFIFTSLVNRATQMNRIHVKNFFYGGGGYNAGYLKGILYISSIPIETSIIELFRDRIPLIKRSIQGMQMNNASVLIFTGSHSKIFDEEASIDYIFTDPPFGGNIMYSELNFLIESWLKVFTNNKAEAIENRIQNKSLSDYQHLMELCFYEAFRVLKPGRWMTIEFHNSQNRVWMAIQEALSRAGFIVADVRTLDKKQGTFKQVTTTAAVKQDLIISAYKPNGGLEERFKLIKGTEEGVWDFIRQHLKHLPVAPEKKGAIEFVTERQKHLLFDRMVAFHVQRGIIVPISAPDFYIKLRQRFPERDGMYFLPDQIPEYEQKRMKMGRVEQLSLFVHDEKSAIQWIRQELTEKPQTFQEIQPKFMIESRNRDKHELLPELIELLEENFLKDDQGGWYVPDPNKESDLEKLREKALLKEFEAYKSQKGKLKQFRTEAIRAGFKKCWSERDYATIISIGDRLPSSILQEDEVLLMYYDNAVTRQG